MPTNNEALKTAARTFADLVIAKLKVFRDLTRGRENTEVTGDFIEELLREYINSWLSPMGIFRGSLWCSDSDRMMQIDGLVWQPSFGPPLLRQGDVLLLHPKTVRAVVEIKTSVRNVKELHERLADVWSGSLRQSGHDERDAIGIVLQHDNPDAAARPQWHLVEGKAAPLHIMAVHAHPIFILFRRDGDFDYHPFLPAIEGMLLAFNFIGNTPRINALI